MRAIYISKEDPSYLKAFAFLFEVHLPPVWKWATLTEIVCTQLS